EAFHAGHELLAGAPGQQLALALVQGVPHLVVGAAVAGPRLLDHARRVDRDVAAVGLLVFDLAGRGVFHGGLRGWTGFRPAPESPTRAYGKPAARSLQCCARPGFGRNIRARTG